MGESVGFVIMDKDAFESTIKMIKDALSLSDEEISIIRRVHDVLLEPTPSLQLQRNDRLSKIDTLRAELVELIYRVNVRRNDLEYKYKETYDETYTMLVKADRPTQQAIDSEIHARSATMRDARLNLANLDSLRGLLYGYRDSLDSSKKTCMARAD